MADLGNLRATCKAMCVVCGAAKVGRRLALRRVLRRRFYLGPEYRDAHHRTGHRRQPGGLLPQRDVPRLQEAVRRNHAVPQPT